MAFSNLCSYEIIGHQNVITFLAIPTRKDVSSSPIFNWSTAAQMIEPLLGKCRKQQNNYLC